MRQGFLSSTMPIKDGDGEVDEKEEADLSLPCLLANSDSKVMIDFIKK